MKNEKTIQTNITEEWYPLLLNRGNIDKIGTINVKERIVEGLHRCGMECNSTRISTTSIDTVDNTKLMKIKEPLKKTTGISIIGIKNFNRQIYESQRQNQKYINFKQKIYEFLLKRV